MASSITDPSLLIRGLDQIFVVVSSSSNLIAKGALSYVHSGNIFNRNRFKSLHRNDAHWERDEKNTSLRMLLNLVRVSQF